MKRGKAKPSTNKLPTIKAMGVSALKKVKESRLNPVIAIPKEANFLWCYAIGNSASQRREKEPSLRLGNEN
jgi:hypothetical protein